MKTFALASLSALLFLSPPLSLSTEAPPQQPRDAIAKVGDELITFGQLNTMMNSAPVVGLSLPALGTSERNQAMVVLLDKAISANLLYLDAIEKGVDKDPEYQRDLQRFSDGILGSLYRATYLVGDIEVTEEDIQDFYKNSISPETEFTDEVRAGIEASIRKARLKERTANMRERLRENVGVNIDESELDPAEDQIRDDSDVLATIDGDAVTWMEAKPSMLAATRRSAMSKGRLNTDSARFEALNKVIDHRIMAKKARAAGLENDPVYKARFAEFQKTRLINLHRSKLVKQMEPSQEELEDHFENDKARITAPEARKIQMVVLETKEEAEQVKQKIEDGEITIYQAALDYSIDPNAKRTLGDMGWVTQGTGFPELDKLTFVLELEELGGPVESPAGWHLIKVLDVRDAQFDDIEDEATRKVTRRSLIKHKLNEYVIDLRKNEFSVVVYEEQLNRLFKEEVEWIAALTEKAQKNPSLTRKRMEAYQKMMTP